MLGINISFFFLLHKLAGAIIFVLATCGSFNRATTHYELLMAKKMWGVWQGACTFSRIQVKDGQERRRLRFITLLSTWVWSWHNDRSLKILRGYQSNS
jgi:hypothetical protein